MVAIIGGNSLGLELSSAFTLGSRGIWGQASMGQANENVYVNATNGNLVIQHTDEFLVGKGPDSAIVRTYNSQAELTGGGIDRSDEWRLGLMRRIVVTGVPGALESFVTRTNADGSISKYVRISSTRYQSTDGTGAHDTIDYIGGVNECWVWTDGSSRIEESYREDGTLFRVRDIDGNYVEYDFDQENQIIARTIDGSSTTLVYSVTGKLQKADTKFSSTGWCCRPIPRIT